MDRKNNSRIGIVGVCCATVLLLTATRSFGNADNGLFDSSLSGWQTIGAGEVVWSPAGLTSDGTGSALLQESQIFPSSSILSQTFYVNPGSETLTFSVRTPLPNPDSETDRLYINLFDQNTNQISLFEWDSKFGETTSPDQCFTGTNIGTGWLYDFIVPVDTLNDQFVTLQFQLDNAYETIQIHTSIMIDDVVLNGGTPPTPAVPVPGAMALVLTGLAALGAFSRKLA